MMNTEKFLVVTEKLSAEIIRLEGELESRTNDFEQQMQLTRQNHAKVCEDLNAGIEKLKAEKEKLHEIVDKLNKECETLKSGSSTD